MASILNKITAKIREDEKENFDSFERSGAALAIRQKPVNILSTFKEEFFVISEVKKASPSKGVIREQFDPVEIALSYQRGGAKAISVITEKNYFLGQKAFLPLVKDKTGLPVLRKDFIIHPFQVYESYNLGADFLLLIAACLTQDELSQLYKLTLSLGMNALVEVHNNEELERALKIKPAIIGINNRDLNTFEVDIKTSLNLKKLISDDIFVVSESGIKNHDDFMMLKNADFSAVLVGESLLRENDTEESLKRLING